jgi:hypothetical protein
VAELPPISVLLVEHRIHRLRQGRLEDAERPWNVSVSPHAPSGS